MNLLEPKTVMTQSLFDHRRLGRMAGFAGAGVIGVAALALFQGIGSDRWIGEGFSTKALAAARWSVPKHAQAQAAPDAGIAQIPAGDERYWLTRPAAGVQPTANVGRVAVGDHITLSLAGTGAPALFEIVGIEPVRLDGAGQLMMLTARAAGAEPGSVVRLLIDATAAKARPSPKAL